MQLLIFSDVAHSPVWLFVVKPQLHLTSDFIHEVASLCLMCLSLVAHVA